MKKSILFLVAVLMVLGVNAQSLIISNYVTNHVGSVNDPTVDAVVTIENHSATDSLFVIAERTVNDTATNHVNLFCFGIACYPPSTSISPTPLAVAPGGSDNTFKSQLLPMQTPGVSEVKYCFYEQNSVSDSVCVRFVYDVLSVGIEDVSTDASFSRPSPNPANAFTAFTYDLKNNTQLFSIEVYNMLGSEVKSIEVPNQQGVLIISTQELENGIYFCSLVSEGKAYLTQKLIVSR